VICGMEWLTNRFQRDYTSGDMRPQRLNATRLPRRKPFWALDERRRWPDRLHSQRFHLNFRQERADFLLVLQRIEPAIDVVAQHPPVSSGPGLSLGAILNCEEIRIKPRALRVLRVKTKLFFFSVFLAEAGWLRYPQGHAERASLDSRILKRCQRSRTDFGGHLDE